jgi:hypothetical protein
MSNFDPFVGFWISWLLCRFGLSGLFVHKFVGRPHRSVAFALEVVCKLKGLLVYTQEKLTSLILSINALSSSHFDVQAPKRRRNMQKETTSRQQHLKVLNAREPQTSRLMLSPDKLT